MDNEVTLGTDISIAIIGLGYVGLPLAIEFGKVFRTVGFDVSALRIDELEQQIDSTEEVTPEDFLLSKHIEFSSDEAVLSDIDYFIVSVPTPIDRHNRPDLSALRSASACVGRWLSAGNHVIYESTVYPGATEEVCVPILEAESELSMNKDFWVGYSPERINPGDREHRLVDILKVTSGSTPEAADRIDALYNSVITAGTFRAETIKEAEAAKVIENTQRDLNIALINELSIIFNRLEINTMNVLAAAGTKWNFLPFKPGLVGGHCIGVDPYYLTHKAQEIGYFPEVILAGRRINDGMGEYVASEVVKLMIKKKIQVADSRVLLLGLAFKENCPDIRNTRVVDIIKELHTYDINVQVYDPKVDAEHAKAEYDLSLLTELPDSGGDYSAVIAAVAHDEFVALDVNQLRSMCNENCVIFDVKGVYPSTEIDGTL